jgi:FAD/FMN-containing dehydrogenase
MERWRAGRMMVNFLSPDEATVPAQVRAAYGEGRYDRLAQVKKAYDPRNMFCMNHNIAPA